MKAYQLKYPEIMDLFDEPIGIIEPHYPIAETVSLDNKKVLLNGLGPDELLGYHYYRNIKYFNMIKKLKYFLSLIPINSGRINRLKRISILKKISELYINSFCGYLWDMPNQIFNQDIIPENWNIFSHVENLFPKAFFAENLDDIKVFNYLDLKLFIGTHHNHSSDKYLMHKGIEGRFPYLDHTWVEFCFFSLENKFKIRKNEQKWLIKILPINILKKKQLTKKRKVFNIPEFSFTQKNETWDRYWIV